MIFFFKIHLSDKFRCLKKVSSVEVWCVCSFSSEGAETFWSLKTLGQDKRQTKVLPAQEPCYRWGGFGSQKCAQVGRKWQRACPLLERTEGMYKPRKFRLIFYSCLFPSLQLFSHLCVHPETSALCCPEELYSAFCGTLNKAISLFCLPQL